MTMKRNELVERVEFDSSYLDDKKTHLKIKGVCNLCGGHFFRANKFERFCKTCKAQNDVYLSSVD